ncbi:MAG: hypothetical protein DRR08_16790 [Candidatus Parabeggiatoa sp. nov. 2]|nr:MAG: hypothetical protein DRR08_16790 [Gammaproteobacteria bacterium]
MAKKTLLYAGILALALPSISFADNRLVLSVSDVDDIAFVAVVNKKYQGDTTVLCEWQANPGCSGSDDLTYKVRTGKNLVLIALYNRVYTGFCLGHCGKYAGDFALRVNNSTVWSRRVHLRDNSRGIKRLWGVKVYVSPSGRISVSEILSRTEREAIEDIKAIWNNRF